MNAQELKTQIDRIEQFADDAKNAARSAGNVPQALRDSIDKLHQQASAAKKDSAADEAKLSQTVVQLEQAADKARDACRAAGTVDAKLKQAVQKAHDELSKLKKQVQQGSLA